MNIDFTEKELNYISRILLIAKRKVRDNSSRCEIEGKQDPSYKFMADIWNDTDRLIHVIDHKIMKAYLKKEEAYK